jgi:hypothetical protein
MVEGLISLVIYLIVIGAVVALLLWLVDYLGPYIPDPLHKIIRVIIIVVAVIAVIYLLLGLVGGSPRLGRL